MHKVKKREQPAEALHQSEEWFGLLVEAVRDYAIFMLDPEGRIATWNVGAELIKGYRAEEILGQHFSCFYPPEAVASGWPEHELATARATGRFEDEGWRIRKDGTMFWANVIITALHDRAGELRGFCKVTRDLTERKRQEEALRQSEERFRLMVEEVRDYAIFMLDPEGRIVTWNVGAERIKGYKADQIIGHHFSRLYPPEDVAAGKPQRDLQQARAAGQVEDEGWRLRKDGSRFWANVLITALHDDSGRLRGFSKVTRDMTERRRYEEMLRSVVNNVVDGIVTIDEHGTIESFNPAAEKLFGYSAAEAVGQNVKLLMPEPYHGEHDQYIASYLDTGRARVIGIGRVVVGQRRDGTTFPMDLAVSEFAMGPRRFFTGIVRDITDRKRNEDQLRDIAAKLSEANRRKTEFLATLAHELRNPLAPIRTGLELMRMAKNDPAILEEVRSMMERQTQQLIKLVDDLLDISRITRGKLELRSCPVRLSDVLQSAVEASRPMLDEAGHDLMVASPAKAIYLNADPHRLAQVLSNLLNNAAKYTPEGGRIWLSAERAGHEVVISVKDTGIGIPAEMQNRIFEMFTQVDRPLEKTYSGLGIGLTLVKSIVEMHGGTVQVRSEGQNQGSDFSLRLPILADAPVDEGAAEHSDEIPTGKCRVLVVDDNKAAAETLSKVVSMLGSEVRTASDGQEALDIAADFLPDIVLMDIGMPRMNGYEAARHLRTQPWGKAMLLVALTGWGQDDDKRRSKEAGFDHHLVKPAEPAELQRLLAAAATRPSQS